MQPITVYSIETLDAEAFGQQTGNACSLLPFTVLKPYIWVTRTDNISQCMQPITVYGIETL